MSGDTMPELAQPFWPPPDFSVPASVTQNVVAMVLDPRFPSLMARVPLAEIEALAALPGVERSKLPSAIVINRVQNRICNHCYEKRAPQQLRACGRCQLTFYCSEQCQARDWSGGADAYGQPRQKHSDWCCRPDAERDTGPLRSAVRKMK